MLRAVKRVMVCVSLLVALGGMASAQTAGEPEQAVELFFSALKTGETGAALGRIARGSILAEQGQQLQILANQIDTALSLYGTPIGEELVFREPLGESVLRFVYLQRFDGLPLVWEFYFYRPRSRWLLINIQFEDQVSLLEKVR